jgi:iron complex transport system substrate-binding protein
MRLMRDFIKIVRRMAWVLPCFAVLLLLTGCMTADPFTGGNGMTVTDADGRTAPLHADARVVACYGSFADCWLLSGGTLAGVTEDAVAEHGLDVGNAAVVGTVKHINMEQLIALAPDYVILSADLAAHRQLAPMLDQLNISYGFFRVDTFDDYAALMAQFCAVTGRPDCYAQYVTRPAQRIEALRAQIPSESRSVLLMRVYSTGMKAKSDDNLAGQILREFGLHNIADDAPSMLEDLSVEQIIRTDPDLIFVSTMGSEDGAQAFLRDRVENDPAWSGLTAVAQGQYKMLPKELFHYKPNERWDESYAYLAQILYPDIFG